MTLSEALITGAVAILVCIINNWVQFNKTKQETDKTVALIQLKLDELSDRVNKHNQLIERTYHLESETALIEQRLTVLEEHHE